MAAGDELIDLHDHVVLKNRIIDGPVSIQHDGRWHSWQPGQARTVVRALANFFIDKSTISYDPVGMEAPIQSLVEIDPEGHAVHPGMSTDPLTAQAAEELHRFGVVNDAHLPQDRYLDENGNPLLRKELLRVTRGNEPMRRRITPPPAHETAAALDDAARAVADAL